MYGVIVHGILPHRIGGAGATTRHMLCLSGRLRISISPGPDDDA
ncbi:protein of unknown function [Cupriavidus taiwanensis]|uniref:Uncharacterized protein n=1 Tax=Cupriavidus taiwanensis TaxID=164546 RepID=A0A9Q7URM6_9BURK|nr:protein of unknown function [Cupriavidus taiwanensis]